MSNRSDEGSSMQRRSYLNHGNSEPNEKRRNRKTEATFFVIAASAFGTLPRTADAEELISGVALTGSRRRWATSPSMFAPVGQRLQLLTAHGHRRLSRR